MIGIHYILLLTSKIDLFTSYQHFRYIVLNQYSNLKK